MKEHVTMALRAADLAVIEGDRSSDAVGVGGPAAGLLAAMRANPGAAIVLVGTDQPFVQPATLRALLDLSGDVAIPVDGRPQTLCAVYRPAVLRCLEHHIVEDPNPSLQSILGQVNTNLVPQTQWRTWGEDGRSWLSVDTPETLTAIRASWPETPTTLSP